MSEGFDGLVDEFEGGQWRFARVAGKDVVPGFRAEVGGLHAHLEALGVGLVAPENGVNGFEEGGHSVIALGAGTVEPGDAAIGAGVEAGGGGGNVAVVFSGGFLFSRVLNGPAFWGVVM